MLGKNNMEISVTLDGWDGEGDGRGAQEEVDMADTWLIHTHG